MASDLNVNNKDVCSTTYMYALATIARHHFKQTLFWLFLWCKYTQMTLFLHVSRSLFEERIERNYLNFQNKRNQTRGVNRFVDETFSFQIKALLPLSPASTHHASRISLILIQQQNLY